MNQKQDAYQTTSTGHKLGSSTHLDKHYFALQKEYEEGLRTAGFQAGWRVLDAGCGNGLFLPLLAELVGAAGEICATDLAPENIAEVQAMTQNADLACRVQASVGNLTALPYAENHFDGLWSANVSQYLTDAQLSLAMREFRRVVKPHGLIAVKEVDISVWQFQPQHPKMMWRLLEQVTQHDTQLSGAMRGTQLPIWFREAGLLDIVSKTTLTERRHPLRRVERDYVRGNLEFLAKLATSHHLPESDTREWQAIAAAPDTLINHPDFCYREMYVITTARVPSAP